MHSAFIRQVTIVQELNEFPDKRCTDCTATPPSPLAVIAAVALTTRVALPQHGRRGRWTRYPSPFRTPLWARCTTSAELAAQEYKRNHAVLLTGGQARREVHGLQAQSKVRSDMQIVCPGRHVLTDVAVTHPLGSAGLRCPANELYAAKTWQTIKRTKYAAIATRHDAELLPFVAETCGDLAPDAVELLDIISGAAAEHLSLWSRQDAARQLLDSVSIAIQKGNAMTRTRRACSGNADQLRAGRQGDMLAGRARAHVH
jgi:hypothetical protein